MNLNISSDQLANPLLSNLLRRLDKTLGGIDCQFFVIGATARDIILSITSGSQARRKTRDLDIAIAVSGWKRFDNIAEAMIAGGFKKSNLQTHRFFYDNYEIDIIPFGEIESNGFIYWPPDGNTAMSVNGFKEVLNAAWTVSIDNEIYVCVAPLHGLFILKLNAWSDRNLRTNKDAEDIWYILDNYYFANEKRNIHPEVYDIDDFDLLIGGAYWLGHDIADILNEEQIAFYRDFLRHEIALDERSRLISQILETHLSETSGEITRALKTISDALASRISVNDT